MRRSVRHERPQANPASCRIRPERDVANGREFFYVSVGSTDRQRSNTHGQERTRPSRMNAPELSNWRVLRSIRSPGSRSSQHANRDACPSKARFRVSALDDLSRCCRTSHWHSPGSRYEYLVDVASSHHSRLATVGRMADRNRLAQPTDANPRGPNTRHRAGGTTPSRRQPSVRHSPEARLSSLRIARCPVHEVLRKCVATPAQPGGKSSEFVSQIIRPR